MISPDALMHMAIMSYPDMHAAATSASSEHLPIPRTLTTSIIVASYPATCCLGPVAVPPVPRCQWAPGPAAVEAAPDCSSAVVGLPPLSHLHTHQRQAHGPSQHQQWMASLHCWLQV